jgi:hypothetical protein
MFKGRPVVYFCRRAGFLWLGLDKRKRGKKEATA